MEPKGSLPYLQEPANGPYLEPDNPIHNLQPHFPKISLLSHNSTIKAMRCFSVSFNVPQYPTHHSIVTCFASIWQWNISFEISPYLHYENAGL
jgi:hypothetical protein